MEYITNIINWFNENKDLVSLAVVATVAILKLTTWGKANAEALDAVVEVIEKQDSAEVKNEVANLDLKDSVKDVIDDKVAKHDECKDNPKKAIILTRELARAIGVKLAKKR